MIEFFHLYDLATQMLCRDEDVAAISEFRLDPTKVIWLDIHDPDERDLVMLAEEFELHPLALEDVVKAHQRPKLEHYPGHLFIVLYWASVGAGGAVTTHEVDLFVGERYVVTVHGGPVPIVDQAHRRWLENRELIKEGSGYLAYLLADAIVDGYFPVVDAISDRIDDLEELVFKQPDPDLIEEIFTLKKELVGLRRVVAPTRDVFVNFIKREVPYFGAGTLLYFQDVFDHLLRIADEIDTHRDILSTVLDAFLTSVSNRTNDIMKVLTAVSTTLMTAALIAGIYGMNFKHMPELQWEHGYYGALAMMVIGAGAVLGFFRYKRYI